MANLATRHTNFKPVTMKRLLKITLGLLGVVLLALIVAPYLFRDRIIEALRQALSARLKAELVLVPSEVSLSLLRSFPDLHVSIGNFGLIGQELFEGDTLLFVKEFSLSLDVKSAWKGEKIIIHEMLLDEPSIFVQVTPEGIASYDIMAVTSATSGAPDSTAASTTIQFSRWEIKDANILYVDNSLNMAAAIRQLNHTGQGDFDLRLFDMETHTTIDELTVMYEGITYLNRVKAKADLLLQMDLEQSRYAFKENTLVINELPVVFEGWFAMPAEGYDMDIQFSSAESSFRNLLSLIPGVYQKQFDQVKTEGAYSLTGAVRGTYSDVRKLLPGYELNLKVEDAMFRYTDLPVAIEKINALLEVNSPDGSTEKLLINLPSFSLQAGTNPLRGRLRLEGLERYDAELKGSMDLGMVEKFYPLDGAQLAGRLLADLRTSGRMSDLEANRPERLTTSGAVQIAQLSYTSPDLPQGLTIEQARLTLNPKQIVLQEYKGTIGQSDLSLKGELTDYLPYLFSETGVLKGILTLHSNRLNLNEWMSEGENTASSDTAFSAIAVPKNIEFEMNATAGQVQYTNMNLRNMKGRLVVSQGVLNMEDLRFNLLGGTIATSGLYDTRTPDQPAFAFGLDVSGLGFRQAYQTFSTIQALAPVAQNVAGTFNTKFSLKGLLTPQLTPVYQSLTGGGDVAVLGAAIENMPILNQLADLLKIRELQNPALRNLMLHAEIENGSLKVRPFNVELGRFKANIAGSTSFTGQLDYQIQLDIKGTDFAARTGQDVVMLGISGTYQRPKIETFVKEMVQQRVQEAVSAVKQEAREQLKGTATDLLRQVTGDTTGIRRDSLGRTQDPLQQRTQEAKEKGKELLREFNPFQRRQQQPAPAPTPAPAKPDTAKPAPVVPDTTFTPANQ